MRSSYGPNTTFSSKKWLPTICISPSFSLKIPKPEFTEILFSVSRNPLAEELSKTSKTGDDFDDLAMTRKIVLVWNRSKAPTKSAPLSLDTAGCQPMPNCILICLGMSDKSKLYPNWPNRNWLKFNPTWKLKRILDLLESRAKVHPIHWFLLCLAREAVLGAYQCMQKVCNSR